MSSYEHGTLPSDGYCDHVEALLGLEPGSLRQLWLDARADRLGRRAATSPPRTKPTQRRRLVIGLVVGVFAGAAVLGLVLIASETRDDPGGASPARRSPIAGLDCVPVGVGPTEYRAAFVDAFQDAGGRSVLGCAINPVHEWGPGMIQDLRGGRRGRGALMALTPERVVRIDGTEWIAYEDLLGPGNTGPFAGYPVSINERCGDAVLMRLEGGVAGPGAMVRSNERGDWFWVHGLIWHRYLDLGGPSGGLGFPVSVPRSLGDSTEQAFQGDRLFFSPATGVLDGDAYDRGERQGWQPPAGEPPPLARACGSADAEP